MIITSSQNPKIRWTRTLIENARTRRESNAFVVEGVRLFEEAISAGMAPCLCLHSEQLTERGLIALNTFSAQECDIFEISPRLMASLSDTETPQGILAVFPIPSLPLPLSPNFLLIADAIHDPGNVGTLLRTALAAGVQGVLLTSGSADVWSPKVVRAGMGAHFRLPIQALTWEEVLPLIQSCAAPSLKFYLADSAGGIPAWEINFRPPLALIIGSEAGGPSAAARHLADAAVFIPMPGGGESLNAAVAAAILMFEVVRQRSQ